MVAVLSYILSELVAAVSRFAASVWYTLDESKQTLNHPSIQWAMQRRPLAHLAILPLHCLLVTGQVVQSSVYPPDIPPKQPLCLGKV